jgi:hypothetical protein
MIGNGCELDDKKGGEDDFANHSYPLCRGSEYPVPEEHNLVNNSPHQKNLRNFS